MANDELELGLDTLGRHNFGNNVIVGASGIMHVFSKKRMIMKKKKNFHNCTEKFLLPSAFSED